MKSLVLSLALTCALTSVASAECFADYKAKQDSPLRLHYGIMQLSGGCDANSARSEISSRLNNNGWTLLQVMSVFGPEGLNQRKDSAGQYFLRF